MRESMTSVLGLVAVAVGAMGSPALPINVTCFNTIALVVGGTEQLSRPGENVTDEPTAVVKVRVQEV